MNYWYINAPFAISWGMYAVSRQIKAYGWSYWRVPTVWIVNTVFWPLGVITALSRKEIRWGVSSVG